MNLTLLSAKYAHYCGTGIGGVLIGLAFWYQSLWWCALLGMVLVVWTIHTTTSTRRAVMFALIAGWIKQGMSVWWLLNAYPADWLGGAPRTHQLGLILFCYIGTTLTTGAGYGVFAYLLKKGASVHRVLFPLYVGICLLIGELAGACFFSLYTYGPHVSLTTYFGYGMSGYALADHSVLRYGAQVGGSFALTVIVGTIAGSIVLLITSRQQKKYLLTALLLGGIILTGYIPFSTHYPPQNEIVAAIGTRYHSKIYNSPSEAYAAKTVLEESVKEALAAGARVVVLPEASQLAGNTSSETILKLLQEFPHVPNAVVVDSYDTNVATTTSYARGYIYDIDANTTYTTDKRFIVPVGEFMPYFHGSVVHALGGDAFFEAMSLREGDREVPSTAPSYVPSILFCFESDSSQIARIKSDRNLIVHVVSHSWFHTPTTLWNQERQALIVQSIYTHRPIIQAGNMAPSALYLPNGTIEYGTIVGEDAFHATIIFSL